MRPGFGETASQPGAHIPARMIADGKCERERFLMKKKTRVTIRTRRTVVVQGLRVRCHQCGAEVPIVSPENAAGVLQTSTGEIHGLLASGGLHAVEEPAGAQLICANSLSEASSENEIQVEGERR